MRPVQGLPVKKYCFNTRPGLPFIRTRKTGDTDGKLMHLMNITGLEIKKDV
jgi:hypothetical protein